MPPGSKRTGVELNARVDVDVAAENHQWVSGLDLLATDYELNVTRLYGILVKMAYTEARRKGARMQLAGPELDDIAHQAAADATLAICRKVADFRGDCRFTTWAYRFVAFDVSSKVTRHHWQRPHVSIDEDDWEASRDDGADTPECLAEGTDLSAAVRRIIDEDLTDRQREAFESIAIRGLPVPHVASEMNSSPNAVYKIMFDARKKLRDGLTAAGYLSPVQH